MNDIENAINAFDDWEAEMDRMAKEKAREWCKDFSEHCVFVSYDTSLCKIDEVYVLTKIQTILLYADIVIDYTFEESQLGGAYKWHVGVYLSDKNDISESESEVESVGSDPSD
jgi:hypothetical protein